MKNQRRYLRIFLFTLLLLTLSSHKLLALEFTPAEAEKIARLIFQNECGSQDAHLVAWNEGEAFPSLGIGHFIWYPEDKKGPFDESFVRLLEFMKQKGVTLPASLETIEAQHAPWPDRETFLEESDGSRATELRKFLKETMAYQALFMIKRLHEALAKIVTAAPESSQASIRQKFLAIALSKNGIYALVDYINFKGEGISPSERYHKQGWGLLQVLEEMNLVTSGKDEPIQEFARAAKKILGIRANNSSLWGYEKKWLKGWKSRIDTYLDTSLADIADSSFSREFQTATLINSEEILALQQLAI